MKARDIFGKEEALQGLRRLRTPPFYLVKSSELGGSNRQQFEQAFSSLGHSFLSDTAAGLLKYELGFQLLEKNQDGTRAVGIFAFKVGDHFLYAPVFFLNGEIKGHELLYLKNQDLFVPLKDSWVNYLLGRKPLALGEGTDRNLRNLGVQGPNLYQLSRAPTKFASAWKQGVLESVAKLATQSPAIAYGDKPFSLGEFVKSSAEATHAMLKLCAARPDIYLHLDKFHPGLAKEAVAHHAKQAANGNIGTWSMGDAPDHVLDRVKMDDGEVRGQGAYEWAGGYSRNSKVKGKKKKTLLEVMRDGRSKEGAKKKKVEVRVLTQPGGPDISDLDTQERERLLRARYVVRDSRGPEEINHAYDVESPINLRNPDATGVYEVLVRPDKFKKCLVLLKPWSSRGRQDFCTVIDLENKAWCNADVTNVWTRSEMGLETFQKWWSELEDAGAEPSGTAVLVTRTGQATVPLSVNEAHDDVWEVYYQDYPSAGYGDPWESTGPRSKPRHAYRGIFPLRDRVRFTNKPGNNVTRHEGGELWMPGELKVISLKPPKKEKKSEEDKDEGCCDGYSRPAPLELGNLADIQLFLRSSTYSLDVSMAKSGFVIKTKDSRVAPDTKEAAVAELILNQGLTEKVAVAALEKAASNNKTLHLLVKAAGPYAANMIQEGPGAPAHPDFPTGYDPMANGRYPTENPVQFGLPVHDLQTNMNDRSKYNPNEEPDQNMIKAVSEAARTGQQEVFDTAMLGGLLKSVRDDTVIDRYLSDLMKGMNALGRLLFSFYWHQDNFADRYGKGDLDEIQDGLRNAFESTGEILLTLKARKVDPGLDEGLSSGDDLEDVANV